MEQKEYVCYSPSLFLYLHGKGVLPKKTGVHQITHKSYAVYDITNELSRFLTEWHDTKPIK